MEKLTQEGVFKATIDGGKLIIKIGDKGSLNVQGVFIVEEYRDAQGAWQRAPEPHEVFGSICLRSNAGAMQERNVQGLYNALGLQEIDLETFQDQDFSNLLVQIRVKRDVYNGKETFKVDALDAVGAAMGGGLAKAPTDALMALQATLGAELRALKPAAVAAPVVREPARTEEIPF